MHETDSLVCLLHFLWSICSYTVLKTKSLILTDGRTDRRTDRQTDRQTRAMISEVLPKYFFRHCPFFHSFSVQSSYLTIFRPLNHWSTEKYWIILNRWTSVYTSQATQQRTKFKLAALNKYLKVMSLTQNLRHESGPSFWSSCYLPAPHKKWCQWKAGCQEVIFKNGNLEKAEVYLITQELYWKSSSSQYQQV